MKILTDQKSLRHPRICTGAGRLPARLAGSLALCLLVAGALASAPARADHAGDGLPGKKQTSLGLYLTANEAGRMLRDPGVMLVDVRSRAEVTFVGMPERANVNIPLMILPAFPEYDPEKGHYMLEANPDFEAAFVAWAGKNGVGEDTPIVLICRSGSRSARAVEILRGLGYRQVWSVVDGFEGDTATAGPAKGQHVVNGWKNAGLAWSYRMRAGQVYPEDM